MESREGMNSGVTVIAPEAPSNYHMASRTESTPVAAGTSQVITPPLGTGIPMTSEKKKRGRPRKYGPDGAVARTLSPMPISASAPPTSSNYLSEKVSVARPASEKKPRNKVGAENLGEWISCSTGGNFLPHMITVEAGEDVTMKIISFSQQGPRAVCIISAVGLISNVTLRQPNSSGGTLTYEGRFEILSLSGSFTPTEFGGSRTSRTGGMSISLASPDGRVVGGTLAGLLIAASPVQVVVGSFLPSNHQEVAKPKKQKAEPKALAYATVSPAAPHSSNMEPRSSNAHTVNVPGGGTQNVMSSSIQPNHWAAMPAVQDSRKSATDINISLHGE
ncbi:AT-hook motif nuclear-localized protein 1-like [Lycium ferocissimum]|uniref:AT-hook motif nuclear-localized protein 1-like n=1 Tax=Lycium ferocissimum TaxID=112874 RepID=UPI002815AAF8|nr:AT-hook motif nuclear-localized protein 1-like [Lycium ferocissimum]XP_059312880.1 AT-hook motif nuclear-localized protein 1-like [Lycium ferocissimum]